MVIFYKAISTGMMGYKGISTAKGMSAAILDRAYKGMSTAILDRAARYHDA